MKSLFRGVLSIALALSAVLPAGAQSYSYMEQLSIDEGLPHTDVSSIVQDGDGFIWIGTYSGLCRYDGNVLDSWDMSSSILKSSRIRSLRLVGKLLYIGTENGGLTIYDTDADRFVTTLNVASNCVNSIFASSDGQSVWACTNSGISQIRKDQNGYNVSSWSLSGVCLSGCTLEGDDVLVGIGRGIGVFSAQEGLRMVCGGIFATDFVRFSDAEILVTSYQGTYIYDVRSETVRQINRLDSRSAFLSGDGDGFVVGTARYGILKYDRQCRLTGDIVPWNSLSRGSEIEVSTIFCDSSDVLWIGTNGSGCFRSTGTNRAFGLWDPFPDNGHQVVTMFVDSHDRLWTSSRDGCLAVLDGNALRRVRSGSLARFHSMPVSAIYEDAQGNIWLGSWDNGVAVVRRSEVEKCVSGRPFELSAVSGLPGTLSVYKLACDSFGRMWITTASGVWRSGRNIGEWANIAHSSKDANSLSDDFTTDLLIDGPTVWVGTRASLNRIRCAQDGSIAGIDRIYVRSEDSAGEFVSFIHKSADDSLWVSVLGLGLAKLTKDGPAPEFRIYNKTTCPEFVNNEFESVLEDRNGNFWLGGFGITRFNPKTGAVRVFTRKDGLQSNSFKIWDAAAFSDGRMALGGVNGFNLFSPDDIKDNVIAPRVRITGVTVTGYPSAGLVRSFGFVRSLRLPYSINGLSVRFSSMHYSLPEKNRYRYMLRGWDDDWHYTDGKNALAVYSNLRPGSYTFYVYGSNSDGVWCEAPASMQVRITPPWYASTAARICYGVLILAAVIGLIIILKKHSEKKHRLDLEEKLKEEQRERNEKELKFHTDFMHEIRTPLTLISTPVEELLSNPNLGKGTLSRLHLVEKSVKILQKHIESVTDLRKSDNGQVRLHVVEVDFARFVQEICLLFQPLAKSRSYEFNMDIQELPHKLFIDKDSMEKVVLNLMSNAIKYSPERGGKIDISLKDTADGALLSVSNLGIGILPEDLPYVFDRFRQGRNNDRGGMGIGLAISKSSVLSHSGKIWAESVPGGVTTFYVLLPYGCAQFKPEDIDRNYENSDHISNYDPLTEFLPAGTEGARSGAEREHLVLVVDDNAELREYLAQLLSARYNVITAADGEEGYDRTVTEQPDLVLTDVVMPKANGLELCRRIKENKVTSHIPVILLSARDLPIYKMEGYQMMADDYITKPFHSELLFSRIDNLIGQRECMRQAFRTEVNIEPSAVTATPMDSKFIQSLIDDIELHMGETDYGVDELCVNVGYSRPQLYRKIKSITGMSAIQFVRSIRLKRAAQLLSSGSGMTVTQIMNAVGFNNISYFSKIFFAEFGVLPKDYKG